VTKKKTVAFWTPTAMFTSEMIAGGVTDLAHGGTMVFAGEPVVHVLARLGYPTYLLTILGVWKLLGGVVLVAPGLLRLKEWVYAGAFFTLSGAVLSGIAVGDTVANIATPVFLAACVVGSWALRPPDRVLGTLDLPGLRARPGD
jgi:hypothetical protein